MPRLLEEEIVINAWNCYNCTNYNEAKTFLKNLEKVLTK